MFDVVRHICEPLPRLFRQGQPVALSLGQSLLTVALLVFLYAGWHVRDEGSISAGLRVAFIDTRAYRVDHQRDLEAGVLQTEVRNAADADRQIDLLLAGLLARTPSADRVRLGIVHNGITGVTGVALLRYDITNVVTVPGFADGPMVVNQPLSDWNGFLPLLLTGRCYFGLPAEQSNAALRNRLHALGASTSLACPVTDSRNRLLGGISITWSDRNVPPTGEQLQALMKDATSTGGQIGSVLDRRGKLSPRTGPPAEG
jgi:hypothetical protein